MNKPVFITYGEYATKMCSALHNPDAMQEFISGNYFPVANNEEIEKYKAMFDNFENAVFQPLYDRVGPTSKFVMLPCVGGSTKRVFSFKTYSLNKRIKRNKPFKVVMNYNDKPLKLTISDWVIRRK